MSRYLLWASEAQLHWKTQRDYVDHVPEASLLKGKGTGDYLPMTMVG